MANYSKIKNFDIANGSGIRVSIFFSGCDFHCTNCFNNDIWDFNVGKQFNREIYEKEIKPKINEHICGISILGGEPLHPKNIKATSDLVDWFIQDFPEKNIWIWTGYTWKELMKRCHKGEDDLSWTICSIDVLVDGGFIEEQKDLTLKWRGSKNQRVIDIKQSISLGKLILLEE